MRDYILCEFIVCVYVFLCVNATLSSFDCWCCSLCFILGVYVLETYMFAHVDQWDLVSMVAKRNQHTAVQENTSKLRKMCTANTHNQSSRDNNRYWCFLGTLVKNDRFVTQNYWSHPVVSGDGKYSFFSSYSYFEGSVLVFSGGVIWICRLIISNMQWLGL